MNAFFEATPWGLLQDLLNVDSDRFDRVWKNLECRAAGRFPPVNAFTDDDAAIVEVLLPGKSGKDVELTIENATVTVADNPAAPEGEGAKKPDPAWKRTIELPFRIDESKTSAEFKDGILRIRLPRKVEVASHRIQIN